MKRIFLTASLVLVVPVSVAEAKPVTNQHRHAYEKAYGKVAKKFGKRTPGCYLFRTCHTRPSDEKVIKSISVLKRMLVPPVAHYSSSTPQIVSLGKTQGTYSSTVSSVCGGNTPYPGGGSCWAIPYSIVLCESHGQNVSNSQGSGANGYYQLMNGGTGSRSAQDQAAAHLWNGGAGAGNWVCRG